MFLEIELSIYAERMILLTLMDYVDLPPVDSLVGKLVGGMFEMLGGANFKSSALLLDSVGLSLFESIRHSRTTHSLI